MQNSISYRNEYFKFYVLIVLDTQLTDAMRDLACTDTAMKNKQYGKIHI